MGKQVVAPRVDILGQAALRQMGMTVIREPGRVSDRLPKPPSLALELWLELGLELGLDLWLELWLELELELELGFGLELELALGLELALASDSQAQKASGGAA